MEKSAVEIITDWIEKNIQTIYYPSFEEKDRKHFKQFDVKKMVFNRAFVLSHLSGVMPDVKLRLQSRKADVSGALPLTESEKDAKKEVYNEVIEFLSSGHHYEHEKAREQEVVVRNEVQYLLHKCGNDR